MTTQLSFDPAFKRTPRQETAQQKALYLEDDPCQIDKWYSACSSHTFETRILPLSIEQAKAIKFMCAYFKLFREHQMQSGEERGLGLVLNYDQHEVLRSFNACDEKQDTLSYAYGESFDWTALTQPSSQQYVQPLRALAQSIDNARQEMDCHDGMFIRLNTRSPKDSAIESSAMYTALFRELRAWNQLNSDNRNDANAVVYRLRNEQICSSFHRAIIKSLCVHSGESAIELLCRSYQRVFTDLNMAMLKQGEENLKLFCVVRKWCSAIDPLFEFRLFVRDYKATALTQYHQHIVLPKAEQYRSIIQQRILQKFDAIKTNLDAKLKDYAIDFAVVFKDKTMHRPHISDGDDEKECKDEEDPIETVYMIEINHEPPIAGTALFDWKNEDDRKVLNGEKPFEFRMHDSVQTSTIDFEAIQNILPDAVIRYVDVLKGDYKPDPEPILRNRPCVLL